MCVKKAWMVCCAAQTHTCPKEGSNRLISKILLRVELWHGVSRVFVVVRCGRVCVCVCVCVCVKKAWMVCCAVPKRTNAQRRVRTAVSRIFDSRDVAY